MKHNDNILFIKMLVFKRQNFSCSFQTWFANFPELFLDECFSQYPLDILLFVFYNIYIYKMSNSLMQTCMGLIQP